MSCISTYVLEKKGIKKVLEKEGWIHAGDLWSDRRKENVHFDHLFDVKAKDAVLYDRLAACFSNPERAEAMMNWPVWFKGDDAMCWDVNYGFSDTPAFVLAISYPDELFHLTEYMECSGMDRFYFRGTRFDTDRKEVVFLETDHRGNPVKHTLPVLPLSFEEKGSEVWVTTQAVFYPESTEEEEVSEEDVFKPSVEPRVVKMILRANKEDFCKKGEEIYLFEREGSHIMYECEEHDIKGLDERQIVRAIEEGRDFPKIK